MDVSPLFQYFIKSISPASVILDLGCGTGIPYGKYAVESGFKLTGIDYSEEMIKLAGKNVPLGNFIVQSMENLKEEEEFDAIYASYSLQLLYPSAFLSVTESCTKNLKRKGLFYISLNEPKTNRGDYAVVMGEKMFFKDYSEEELTAVFKKLGMVKLAVEHSVEESETFGREYKLEIIFKKH